MKRCLLLTTIFIVVLGAQAQYDWTEINSPTTVDLRTAMIMPDGNIYVFGDSAAGFRTSDNGQTWESLPGIDDDRRAITTCNFNGETLYVAGKDGLAKFYSTYGDWRDINIAGIYNVSKLDKDSAGNIWCLPDNSNDGIAYRYESARYGDIYRQRLYNFYLPPELDSRYPGSTHYVSCLAGNRIFTFLGDAAHEGINAGGYFSDDLGKNWDRLKPGNKPWPFALIYIESISFNGSFGIMVGCHHGGYNAPPIFTKDGGKTWSQYQTGERTPTSLTIPQSVYVDFDTTYRVITVGSIYKEVSSNYENSRGFIRIDSAKTLITTDHGLNYVDGRDGKLVVVGDSGMIFIGQKKLDAITKSYVADRTDYEFSICPNPTTDRVNIRFADNNQHQVQIFDIAGKEIVSLKGAGSLTWSPQQKGLYIVKSENYNAEKIIVK